MRFEFRPIGHQTVEWIFILLPAFLCTAAAFYLPEDCTHVSNFWLWLLLVVCVDVAHVYATLFRTYGDPETFKQHKQFLLILPFLVFILSLLLFNSSETIFWRVVAYLAVFHFIRQQYGFLKLYSRFDENTRFKQRIDQLVMYAGTLYPILFWHLKGDRSFYWMIQGDFWIYPNERMLQVIGVLYAVVLCMYVVSETYQIVQTNRINIPKNLIVVGTICSWFVGIVLFNGDLIFTLLNVVAHGIPYMALVWIWGRNKSKKEVAHQALELRSVFRIKYGVIGFVGIVLFYAITEEVLWDYYVWQEHLLYIGLSYPEISEMIRKLIIPTLIVPQVVHYVIDGFIWKIRNDRFNWMKYLRGA